MVNKNLFDITEALNINGLDLVATAGGGEDYSVSLEQLALEVEKELLRPFLLDKIGHFMIDITNRFNGALEAQDNYFKYIKAGAAADGSNSGGWVFPEPYPLLQGKVSAFLDNRGVEYLAIGSPNGIPAGLPIADRTIRQVNANETVGVLQEDDIKSHTHGMNHDHDMSHQHQYYTYAGNMQYASKNSGINAWGYVVPVDVETTGGRDRTGGSSTTNTGATGSTTRMKNLGVNLYLIAGLVE